MSPATFAAAAGERAVKTFAQALLALLAGTSAGLLGVNWTAELSIAGMAAVLSLLTSLASLAGPGAGTVVPPLGADLDAPLPPPTWPDPKP